MSRRRDALERGLCAAVFALCCIMTAYYLIAGYGAYLDSDMASELVLARHLCDTGTLISTSWHYSTEIRLLATQLVYAPVMGLFGHDWQLVRTLGDLILMAMLAGACFFAARQAGAERHWALLFAGLSICPVSPLYAEFIVIGTCYVPYAVLTLLVLGLYARAMRPGRHAGSVAVLLVLALLMGMSSVRYLLCALLPLCGAALWQFVFAAREEAPRTRRQAALLALGLGTAASGAAGYLFAQKVLSRVLHWGNGYYAGAGYAPLGDGGLADKAQLIAKGLLDVLGYEDGASLFSLHGVLNALILLGLIVCGMLVVRLLRTTRLAEETQAERPRFGALMLVIAAGLSFAMFLLLRSMYFDRYWIPVVVLAMPVLAAALSRERNAIFRALAAGLLCVTVLVPTASCIKNSMAHPEYVTDKRMAAVEAIRERGLTLGYATFWNANIVTELSDGEIEVVALEIEDGSLRPYRWLEAEENFAMDAPEEPVFLLLGVWEEGDLADFLTRCQAVRVELDGWINLYEIPSQRVLFEAMGSV